MRKEIGHDDEHDDETMLGLTQKVFEVFRAENTHPITGLSVLIGCCNILSTSIGMSNEDLVHLVAKNYEDNKEKLATLDTMARESGLFGRG